MKIGVIGGGPAGLYFSVLIKQACPDAQVRIWERNPAGATFGWGVVFSDETLSHFENADAVSYQNITNNFIRWDTLITYIKDQQIRSEGHGFCGISRKKLLEILQNRCLELGVELLFQEDISYKAIEGEMDLVVAADGINSRTRNALQSQFKPTIEPGRSKFIWLGTPQRLEAFTFIFRRNSHGLFQVHAYPFDENTSTFIVETDEDTWKRAGFDRCSVEDSIGYCEKLFAPELNGHRLLSNQSDWINFREVRNKNWHTDKLVLIGDAAHTAHFSIGSGTKLAMEDSIALAESLSAHKEIPVALKAYQDARWVDVAKLQKSALVSQRWFEEVNRYRHVDPLVTVVSMLTRSKRITHQNLKMRDPQLIAAVDRQFAEASGCFEQEPPPPPMFTPFKLRGLKLKNRVVVSAMCQYSAKDGVPDDWHLVHLGSRAVGGAGLVMTEMTNISASARITPGCTGIYTEKQAQSWARIVDFVHEHSEAKIGIQLSHAGRKGSTQELWKGMDLPLEKDNWPLLAASAIPYREHNQVPKAMDEQDMEQVCADFVASTRFAEQAGFDLLELHMAHGYLLSTFLSPLTNQRSDEYGGSLTNRLRFPLRVFDQIREVWPSTKPISVRISATDWAPGGLVGADAVEIARALKEHGCDLIDVSTGQTVPQADPLYGRMYQTPFSDQIRHEVGIATMAVGAIQNWDHVNTILISGRADLCALARPHLYDPYFTLHAAAEQDYQDCQWPNPYLSVQPRSQRVPTKK